MTVIQHYCICLSLSLRMEGGDGARKNIGRLIRMCVHVVLSFESDEKFFSVMHKLWTQIKQILDLMDHLLCLLLMLKCLWYFIVIQFPGGMYLVEGSHKMKKTV